MDAHRAGDAMQTPKDPTAESEALASGLVRESLAAGEGGAIYVEFLIAFFPVFIMVLGIIQISLMYTAHVVVQHSASTAVRAAIVVIPDDPARYGGVPTGQLAEGDGGDPGIFQGFLSLLGGVANVNSLFPRVPILDGLGGGGGGGGSDASSPRSVYASSNARMRAIHAAANIPLASISPSIDQLLERETSVRDALGRNEPVIRAATALIYNQAAMAVTFPTAPNATTYGNSFYDNQPVTVRVTYMFHCAVPIARMFICKDPINLRFGDAYSDSVRDAIRRGDAGGIVGGVVGLRPAEAAEIARNPGLGELTVAPLYSLILATSATGQRYVVLRGEATLPLQGAQYQYRQRPRGGAGGGF